MHYDDKNLKTDFGYIKDETAEPCVKRGASARGKVFSTAVFCICLCLVAALVICVALPAFENRPMWAYAAEGTQIEVNEEESNLSANYSKNNELNVKASVEYDGRGQYNTLSCDWTLYKKALVSEGEGELAESDNWVKFFEEKGASGERNFDFGNGWSAGRYGVKIAVALNDNGAKYAEKTFAANINKAQPSGIDDFAPSIVYGQKASDCATLENETGTWSFDMSESELEEIKNVGEYGCYATFVPKDSANYERVEHKAVTLKVTKKRVHIVVKDCYSILNQPLKDIEYSIKSADLVNGDKDEDIGVRLSVPAIVGAGEYEIAGYILNLNYEAVFVNETDEDADFSTFATYTVYAGALDADVTQSEFGAFRIFRSNAFPVGASVKIGVSRDMFQAYDVDGYTLGGEYKLRYFESAGQVELADGYFVELVLPSAYQNKKVAVAVNRNGAVEVYKLDAGETRELSFAVGADGKFAIYVENENAPVVPPVPSNEGDKQKVIVGVCAGACSAIVVGGVLAVLCTLKYKKKKKDEYVPDDFSTYDRSGKE